jgi:predicted anti-sigma-YlaC factor YlaD
MLTCNDVTDRFTEYDDRKLPRLQRWQIRVHLLMCGHCRRFYAQMTATVAAMRQLASSATETSPGAQAAVDAFKAWRRDPGE